MPLDSKQRTFGVFSEKLSSLGPGDYFSVLDSTGKERYYKALSRDRYIDLELNTEIAKIHLLSVAAPNIKLINPRDVINIRQELFRRRRQGIQAVVDFETRMDISRIPTYDDIYQVGVKLHPDIKSLRIDDDIVMRNRDSMLPGDSTGINYIAKKGAYTNEFIDTRVKELQKRIDRERSILSKKVMRKSRDDVDLIRGMERELNYLKWEKQIYQSSKGKGAFSAFNLSSLAKTDGTLDFSKFDKLDTITNPQVFKEAKRFYDMAGNPANLQELRNYEDKVYGYKLYDKKASTDHYLITSQQEFEDIVNTLHMKYDVRSFSDYEHKIFNMHINANREAFKGSRIKFAGDLRAKINDTMGVITGHDTNALTNDWHLKYGSTFKDFGIDPRKVADLHKNFKYGFNSKYIRGVNVENLYNVMQRYDMLSPENLVSEADKLQKSQKWYSEMHLANKDVVDEIKISNFFDDLNYKFTHAQSKEAISIRDRLVSSYEQAAIIQTAIGQDPTLHAQIAKKNLANRLMESMDNSLGNYTKIRKNIEQDIAMRAASYTGRDHMKELAYMRGGRTAMGLLSASLLAGGVAYTLEKLRRKDVEQDKHLEGIRHDSLLTYVNREWLTDFGSGLRATFMRSARWGKIVRDISKYGIQRMFPLTARVVSSYKGTGRAFDYIKEAYTNRLTLSRSILRDIGKGEVFGRFLSKENIDTATSHVTDFTGKIVDTIRSKDKMASMITKDKILQPFMAFKAKIAENKYIRYGLVAGGGAAIGLSLLTPKYEGQPTPEERMSGNEFQAMLGQTNRNMDRSIHDSRYTKYPGLPEGGMSSMMRGMLTDFGSPLGPTVRLGMREGMEDGIERAFMSAIPDRYYASPMARTLTDHNAMVDVDEAVSSLVTRNMLKDTDMYGNLMNKRPMRRGSTTGLRGGHPLSELAEMEDLRMMPSPADVKRTEIRPDHMDNIRRSPNIATGADDISTRATQVARDDMVLASRVQERSQNLRNEVISAAPINKTLDVVPIDIEPGYKTGVGRTRLGSYIQYEKEGNLAALDVVPDAVHRHPYGPINDTSTMHIRQTTRMTQGDRIPKQFNSFFGYGGARVDRDEVRLYNKIAQDVVIDDYATKTAKVDADRVGDTRGAIEERTFREPSNSNEFLTSFDDAVLEGGSPYPARRISWNHDRFRADKMRLNSRTNSERTMENFNAYNNGYKSHRITPFG